MFALRDLGRRASGSCCSRAIASASSRSTTPSANGELVFASELKPILQLPDVDRSLELGSGRPPVHVPRHVRRRRASSTACKKLEPARVAIASRGSRLRDRTLLGRHVRARRAGDGSRARRAAAGAARRVGGAASGQRRAGRRVPERRHRFERRGRDDGAAAPDPVKTFSIGFREAGFDELAPRATRSRRCFGTDHHELVLEPDVVPIVEDLAWYLDEPFGDTSAIPTYMVSKLAAEHVKVVLTGDGGDELFARLRQVRRRRARARVRPRAGVAAAGRPARSATRCPTACAAAGSCGISRSTDRGAISTRQTLFRADEMRKLFQR